MAAWWAFPWHVDSSGMHGGMAWHPAFKLLRLPESPEVLAPPPKCRPGHPRVSRTPLFGGLAQWHGMCGIAWCGMVWVWLVPEGPGCLQSLKPRRAEILEWD